MLEKYGVTANELRVVGGGSKNRLWRRIIADAFQLPLRFPAEPESAALGGALQAAAVCAGVPVAEYVAENEPPCEEEVNIPPSGSCNAGKQESSLNVKSCSHCGVTAAISAGAEWRVHQSLCIM